MACTSTPGAARCPGYMSRHVGYNGTGLTTAVLQHTQCTLFLAAVQDTRQDFSLLRQPIEMQEERWAPSGISPDSEGVQRELCTVSAQPTAWLAARRTIGPTPRPPAPGTGVAAWGKRLKSGERQLSRRIGRTLVRLRLRPGLRGFFACSLRGRSAPSTLGQYEQRPATQIP
jgi:hypothetical protein